MQCVCYGISRLWPLYLRVSICGVNFPQRLTSTKFPNKRAWLRGARPNLSWVIDGLWTSLLNGQSLPQCSSTGTNFALHESQGSNEDLPWLTSISARERKIRQFDGHPNYKMQDSDHSWLEGHDDPGYSRNRVAYQVQRA